MKYWRFYLCSPHTSNIYYLMSIVSRPEYKHTKNIKNQSVGRFEIGIFDQHFFFPIWKNSFWCKMNSILISYIRYKYHTTYYIIDTSKVDCHSTITETNELSTPIGMKWRMIYKKQIFDVRRSTFRCLRCTHDHVW